MSRNRYAAAYAEALFAAARKLGRAEELGEMLLSLKKRMEEDDEIAKILQYDLISRQEKEKALTEFLPRLLQREKDEISGHRSRVPAPAGPGEGSGAR